MTELNMDTPVETATASPSRWGRRFWQTVVPVVLVLVLGIGGKLASLDALRDVQILDRIAAEVSRVEVAALQMALSFRRGDETGPRAQAAAVLGRRVMALEPGALAQRFPADPVVGATLRQLALLAEPGRLSALAERGAIVEADAIALLTASTADAVHAAIGAETVALWQRVWALGGGAVAGLLLTAVGGSALAAVAMAKVQGFVRRVEDYARRLRQADAVRATAVAEAEIAAVARTKALMAETVARLQDARRLAEAAKLEAETGRAATAAALEHSRRAATEGRAMLEALALALEAPLDRIRTLSPGLRIGHTIAETDRVALDEIERASIRLNRIARGALDLVRGDDGQTAPVLKAFRPELLLQRVHDALAETARQSGASFRIAVDESAIESCLGDPARVESLIGALASHAIEGAGRGGVTLVQRAGSRLAFVLHAPGLPANDLDAATAADPGLGLVRAMTLALGGTLMLEDGGDHGPALCLVLPTPPIEAKAGP